VIGWRSSVLWENALGTGNLVLQLLELSLMSVIVLGLFGMGAWLAKVPEVSLLGDRLLKKFKRA
ncbi:MAG: lipid II flippase MurJ, partial [Synechocystis sp.]